MSRVNIVALVTLLLLLIWLFAWDQSTIYGLQRNALGMTAPFVKMRNQVERASDKVTKPRVSRDKLEEANRRLLKEVRQLRIDNSKFDQPESGKRGTAQSAQIPGKVPFRPGGSGSDWPGYNCLVPHHHDQQGLKGWREEG